MATHHFLAACPVTYRAHTQTIPKQHSCNDSEKENQTAECTCFEIPPTFPFDLAEEMRHYNLNRCLIYASWTLLHKSTNNALHHLYTTKTYKGKATQSRKKKLAKHVTISFYMPVNKAEPRKPNNWMGKYDRRLKIE